MIAAGLAVVVVTAFVLAGKLQPAPAPLALPAAAGGSPARPAGGTWDVTAGSAAGFRVTETVLGLSNDVVGRTSAVTGTVVISGRRVTSATFRIDLTAVKVGHRTSPELVKILGVRSHPAATFTLAQPVTLPAGLATGSAVRVTGRGELTLRGTARMTTVTISARRSGPDLQIVGSIFVTFSRWGIEPPAGYGILGSLANHGIAEFLLVLRP
jgi:polyisoprenoid-binding protein YceI